MHRFRSDSNAGIPSRTRQPQPQRRISLAAQAQRERASRLSNQRPASGALAGRVGKEQHQSEHPMFQRQEDEIVEEFVDTSDWKNGSLGGKSKFIMPAKLGVEEVSG